MIQRAARSLLLGVEHGVRVSQPKAATATHAARSGVLRRPLVRGFSPELHLCKWREGKLVERASREEKGAQKAWFAFRMYRHPQDNFPDSFH